MRSFSTKYAALGILCTSQCLVMEIVLYFSLTNAITKFHIPHNSGKSLRSKGNKTFQQASFFIPSSMFIVPPTYNGLNYVQNLLPEKYFMYFFLLQSLRNLETPLLKQIVYSIQVSYTYEWWMVLKPLFLGFVRAHNI